MLNCLCCYSAASSATYYSYCFDCRHTSATAPYSICSRRLSLGLSFGPAVEFDLMIQYLQLYLNLTLVPLQWKIFDEFIKYCNLDYQQAIENQQVKFWKTTKNTHCYCHYCYLYKIEDSILSLGWTFAGKFENSWILNFWLSCIRHPKRNF